MKKVLTASQWVLAAFFVLLMLGTGSLLSNFFLFIAVFLMAPIKPIRNALEKIKIKGFVCVILAVILFFVAMIVSPNKEIEETPLNNPSTTIEEITEANQVVVNTQNTTKEVTTANTTYAESTTITEETATPEEEITKKTQNTTKNVETTSPKIENTTKKTEESTTKKQETTTKKVEESTTKKQETTTKKVEETKAQSSNTRYILNTNTGVFHNPNCRHVKTIKPENYYESTESRDVIVKNYRPCGTCKP
jgi:cytoskeletal protein RodZ